MRTRVAVIGAGALGAYYGARLAHGGCDVHFLVRGDYSHVARHGLRVESPHGDFSIPEPAVYRHAEDLPPCELVLICVKAVQNQAVARGVAQLLARDGSVVLMQNGLGGEEFFADEVPGHAIIGGLAFLCSHKVGPGHVRHLDYGQVSFGPLRGGSKGVQRVAAVAALFRHVGIESIELADLASARWGKLVWNVPFNGLSVLHDCDTRGLLDDPAHAMEVAALMDEVIDAGRACGAEIPGDFRERMLAYTRAMVPYLPSMNLDYDAGRPLELEAIYGEPIRRAAAAGAPMHRSAALLERLQLLARRRKLIS